MSKTSDEIEAKVRDRLTIDESGTLVVGGLRSVILPARTLADLSVAGESTLGPGMAAVLYLAGERTGVEIADIAQRSVRGDVPPGVLLDRMRKDVELRGFGRITVASFDPRTGEAIIRIKNSPYADPSAGNGHGCRFPAGFWAGVVSALARRPVVSEEMQCLRGGGELCEFRVFPTS